MHTLQFVLQKWKKILMSAYIFKQRGSLHDNFKDCGGKKDRFSHVQIQNFHVIKIFTNKIKN